VPCGADASRMPIGLQLIGPPFGEEAILRAGDAWERAGGFTQPAPQL
jgi:aspartyl-tRNA(Asn)/glutamyl-tRNA(Gln) amidotransferase subunit A